MLPWIKCGVIRIFLMLIFLWKFLFWTLSIFKRGPDIRIFPTLSNFQNVNFIYTNFSRVRLDFIYSNAGWALFHANRSLFRIIWWNWRIMYNNYKIYYQYLKNEISTEPKNHRTQEPPNSEIICSRFCYSSVGIWPLSNILRSRSVIAQWVYEQYSNILRNHLKRHRPTSMIELSQHHNGSKEKLDWRMTAGACQRMRQMSFFVFRKSNVSKSKNRKTFRLQRPLGDRTNLHKLKHLDRAITRWRSHDPSVSGVRKLFERYKL